MLADSRGAISSFGMTYYGAAVLFYAFLLAESSCFSLQSRALELHFCFSSMFSPDLFSGFFVCLLGFTLSLFVMIWLAP